jgi:hypothetical protein
MMKMMLKTRFCRTKTTIVLLILCSMCSFGLMAQTDEGKPMDAKSLTALVEELKGVVSRTELDEKKSAAVAAKWDSRKDLAGKTRKQLIDLLYEDVKVVIKDSGTQYQIYSIFSFYRTIPDSAKSGQRTFESKDASTYFDIKISVEKCDEIGCSGKASFAFFNKDETNPYQAINLHQVISLPNTFIGLDEGNPNVNETRLYDQKSVVYIGDFNFDGIEDVAICDGQNGAEGMPSYQVYLASESTGKFVNNKALSDLVQGLEHFRVIPEDKKIVTEKSDGCCLFITEGYSVVNDLPVKIFEEVEDATIKDKTKIKITTKKLVNGKWQTNVKFVKR